MARFTLLVTADAFRASAATAEPPALAAGGEVLYPLRMGPLPAEELTPWLSQADAVIAASDHYTAEVLEACPRLRVIVRWGTGYDAVDLGACNSAGVLACNAPGLNIASVADHSVGLMLALARRLPEQLGVIRSGGWAEIRGTELWRKTVGLVGFGAIGKGVARRVRGFDCRLLVFDPSVSAESVEERGGRLCDLETLFTESDYISIHAALTPENRGLVSGDLLARMKPTAYLVNCARGGLIDEPALVQALASGSIAGAGLDAFACEPLGPDHPLRRLPNCLATPHSAFNSEETAAATNRCVVEQAIEALRGGCPRYALNPEVLTMSQSRLRVPVL
jgi:phosphoglycerate dehydrogenase-like enzyme